MSIAAHIKSSLELPGSIVRAYVDDLSDKELLLRPQKDMNHIAWQFGHLIVSENFHINQLYAGCMPALPDGFAAMHTRETAPDNRRASFCPKAEYLQLMDEQRAGTLAVLAGLDDEALLQPAPEGIRYFGPTVGSVFAGESTHWMMHAGQWAVVRRMLGKPPLF